MQRKKVASHVLEVKEHPLDCGVNLWNAPAGGASLGGDWCEAFALSNESIAISIGDVSGHGEAAAESMATIRSAMFWAMNDNPDPSRVLSAVNSVAYGIADGLIVTAIAAILDRRHHTLKFANAGHPPPLVMTADGHGFLSHVVGDLPLGVFARHRCADYVVAVPADALIVFYTDGITEHERDILRGEEQLVDACRFVYDLPVPDVARSIAREILKAERGEDDAAVLAVRAVSSAAAKQKWLGACGPGGYRFDPPVPDEDGYLRYR